MTTQAEFFAVPLVRAVHLQLGTATEAETLEDLAGLLHGGADAGWVGFTWTSDTVAFAQNFADQILRQLKEDREDLGVATVSELVAGFACLGGQVTPAQVEAVLLGSAEDEATVLDALAKYALETVARWAEDVQTDAQVDTVRVAGGAL